MIVLDTNVISELMKLHPHPKVFAWAESQLRSQVFTTAITVAEIRFGIALMPDGARRNDILADAIDLFSIEFEGHILSFDADSAEAYATIAARRRGTGRPISQADAQIAGIVWARRATLATRNTRDFEDCGFEVIDPWVSPP